MKVGIIQSNFIPWRGYFDFIDSVDLFVFHDDLQFTKGDWRNRNKIKTPHGPAWLTVPVHYKTVNQRICETPIQNSNQWRKKHWRLWKENYQKAKYFKDIKDILFESGLTMGPQTISELNLSLIKKIASYLKIETPLKMSKDFSPKGNKTERLIDMLKKMNATTYVSGPSAQAYLDTTAFKTAGIRLEYKSYDYEPYPQLWGYFEGGVTVLDCIANCGPKSKKYIKSMTPNIKVNTG